jgi:2,3-bisphosphoglycerate-dependent phosphoglycerate mutase
MTEVREYRQHRFRRPAGACELLIVRHGESAPERADQPFPQVDGQGDPELSTAGREQAIRVAERLEHEDISAIYVTTLQRTAQTAAPLAARLGLEPRVERDLREVFLGEWEGSFRRNIAEGHPTAARVMAEGRWDVIPGAEPDDEFRGRVQRAIERIAAAHPDEVVVAVVHGGVIGQAMNIASGARGFAFTGSDNASVSHLVITPYRWIIRCFNDTAHLSDRFSTADEPPPVTGIRPAGVTF